MQGIEKVLFQSVFQNKVENKLRKNEQGIIIDVGTGK